MNAVVSLMAERFWMPWEATADSFERVRELIHGVFDRWSAEGRVFAWRGLADARWALHSSLYRRALWTSTAAKAPKEADLYAAEGRILVDLHRWGLHMGEFGRLSILSQLAVLQHYGAPTRLIDVAFNPWIGLWFAVEQQWDNGVPRPDVDARLFAIDVTDRLINENDRRSWEDDFRRPWPRPVGKDSEEEHKANYREWTTQVLAWRPPHFHPRLAAQNGGFILGGVPTTGVLAWPKSTLPADGRWKIDEVRRAVSVPLRVHKLEATAGGPSADAVYTVRITASAVSEVRRRLQELFGYRHSTIYPDYTGFASFGTPKLKSSP